MTFTKWHLIALFAAFWAVGFVPNTGVGAESVWQVADRTVPVVEARVQAVLNCQFNTPRKCAAKGTLLSQSATLARDQITAATPTKNGPGQQYGYYMHIAFENARLAGGFANNVNRFYSYIDSYRANGRIAYQIRVKARR